MCRKLKDTSGKAAVEYRDCIAQIGVDRGKNGLKHGSHNQS